MDPSYGGPSQCLRDLIPEWNRHGCSNEVLCLDASDSPFLGKDPFPIHAVGERKGPLGYHSALFPWLLEHLCSYDSVVIHGLWQWHTLATRRACRHLTTKVPYFVMPHGNLDPWFQRDKSRRLKAVRNWLYWKLCEHRVIRDAEAMLFTCEEELQLAREAFFPYRPRKAAVVGLGVPPPPAATGAMTDAFRKSCPELPESQPYLLFLSRLHPKKGVDILIKAYAEVFGLGLSSQDSPLPSTVPALVIAGPLESDFAREMIHLAGALLSGSVFTPSSTPQLPSSTDGGNRPSIHFTGMLQGDSKWGAFYGCEAFILPSHQENFGIAVAEALACDKPVLISNKVNIWREIESSGGGLVREDTEAETKSLMLDWSQKVASGNHSLTPIKCYQAHFTTKECAARFVRSIAVGTISNQ